MIPKGRTPKNGGKVFVIMKATSTKVIPEMMPARVRDWISSAFRHAGNTALTFRIATRINPPDAAWAEQKPHRGLPLTGTARPTGGMSAVQGLLMRGLALSWTQKYESGQPTPVELISRTALTKRGAWLNAGFMAWGCGAGTMKR
jgi:hypothetical protein